ncbi:PUA-like domain-containing protein [Diaporthe sp. PMI_573]|nr:PUA-like domain-containing protein [Diaporthaceae sp. PMI_573]
MKWFETEKSAIQNFAQASIRAKGVPDLDSFKHSVQLKRTRGYLDLLEFDTNMSPELNNSKAQIQQVLELINRPRVYFPEDVKQRAERLHQRFQAENWGAAAANATPGSDDDDEEEEEQVASPTTAAAPAAHIGEPASATVTIRLPPPNHPIWGQSGIMHGIAVTQNGKKKLDPRGPRRSAKVPGHNGLDIGAWFPTRLSALVDGAHGASQAGISGNIDYGAFSIVVAATYKEVDDDCGETIWYSAPGSAENEDRNAAPQRTGTGQLQRSLTTRNPVRVLRAANKESAYAPSVGIRYDGLYVVTRQETSHNSKGGLYFKYLLERLPDQKPLNEVTRESPTAQQMADHGRINDLW